jgi:Resolvase, N terminal domain
MSPEHKRTARCAIYTRKSSEEGLEQSFNSLEAQREACEAFIASQREEGWRLLPAHYDDGGYSGGNMDRPALQQLFFARGRSPDQTKRVHYFHSELWPRLVGWPYES